MSSMEMDESQGSGGALPPFLVKTYEMVDDPETNSMVCWGETGYSFVVWNPADFSRDLLPRYFKHNNFSSFVRQLNTYGFRKIDPDQWEFANEEFIRGQKHLLKNIHRRKPIHSHSLNPQLNSGVPLTDMERKEFGEEIKRLNQDKTRLQSQLRKHQKENHEFQLQIRLLSERFLSMENRQRQVMVILAKLIDKPIFMSMLKQKTEFQHKKRKSLNSNPLFHEFINTEEEHHGLTSQNLNQLGASYAPMLNLEQIEKLESSIKSWETLFYGIGETMGEDVYDIDISSLPPPFVVTEMQASSGNHNIDAELFSPSSHPCSPPYSTDNNSSPDLSMSAYHVDSPIPCFQHIDNNSSPDLSGIGLTSDHASLPETDALQEQIEPAVDHPVQPKVNDVFWEQFLTEAPMSDAQYNKRNSWWKTSSIDHL